MNNILSQLPLLQATAPTSGAALFQWIVPFGLVILIFYFLIIRPQNKRQKETQRMIEAIKKGDKIITIGGIRGTVQHVKEETVIVQVDDNAKLEFNKNAISTVVQPKEAKEESKKESKKDKKS